MQMSHATRQRWCCLCVVLLCTTTCLFGQDKPELVAKTPAADAAVGAGQLVALYATFDQPIHQTATTGLTLVDEDTGSALPDLGDRTWIANGPTGGVLVIPLTESFAAGGSWHLAISDGFISSQTGAAFEGIVDPTAWHFVTTTASGRHVRPQTAAGLTTDARRCVELTVNRQGIATVTADVLAFINTDAAGDTDAIRYRLQGVPQHGTLVGPDDTALEVGDAFTQADIDAGSVRYEHEEDSDKTDYLAFTVGSATHTHSPQLWLPIRIGSQDGTPVFEGVGPSLTYTERTAGLTAAQIQPLEPASGFTQIKDTQADFDSGTLTLRFAEPLEHDRISIDTTGSITVDADGVTLRWQNDPGRILGTIDTTADGLSGNDLVIALGPAAVPDTSSTDRSALTDLLDRVRFENRSRALQDGTRTFYITLDDGIEGASTQTRTIVIDAIDEAHEDLVFEHSQSKRAVLAGNVTFSGHLRCRDPEGTLLSIRLDPSEAEPTLGTLTFDPSGGTLDADVSPDSDHGIVEPVTVWSFDYTPVADAYGTETLHLLISDGVNETPEQVELVIARPDAGGIPYLVDDPPLAAVADVASTWSLRLSPAIPGGTSLLQEEPPVGVGQPSLSADGSILTFVWTPTASTSDRTEVFSILLTSDSDTVAASLPFTIVVPGVPSAAQ